MSKVYFVLLWMTAASSGCATALKGPENPTRDLAQDRIPNCSGIFTKSTQKAAVGYQCKSSSGVVWTKIKAGAHAAWESEGLIYHLSQPMVRRSKVKATVNDYERLIVVSSLNPSAGCGGAMMADYSQLNAAAANGFFQLIPKVKTPLSYRDAKVEQRYVGNPYPYPVDALVFYYHEVVVDRDRLEESGDRPSGSADDDADYRDWSAARSAHLCIQASE